MLKKLMLNVIFKDLTKIYSVGITFQRTTHACLCSHGGSISLSFLHDEIELLT